MVLLPSCGLMMLTACGSTEEAVEEAPALAASAALQERTKLVSATTPAYYNDKLGKILDGTDPRFPHKTDVEFKPIQAPNLEAAENILGGWLSITPLPLNSSWSGLRQIPATWVEYTETAIVYVLDAGPLGMEDVKANFRVDNGVFVWLDGQYKYGAVAPGGVDSTRWEYEVPLGRLQGKHYLQVLREDHGGDTGYAIEVTGVATRVPSCERNPGRFTSSGTTAALHLQQSATLLTDGRVLAVGGFSRTVELYNPVSGSWSVTGSTRTTHRLHTATRLKDGRVLVAGGEGTTASDSAEVYDPATGSWTSTGNLRTNRREHSAVLLADGRVLVMGGTSEAGGVLASAEVYDPASGTWTSTGGMALARGFHAAVALGDGKVLVTGGAMDGPTSARAEVYDPATGTWTATGDMSSPRRRHTLTFLENGLVLVTGGYDAWTGIQASAELYSSSTGTWCTTGRMTQGRYEHTATLLTNGRVLITTGVSNSSQYTSEVYDLSP